MSHQDFEPVILRKKLTKEELKRKGLLKTVVKNKTEQKSKDILSDNPSAPKKISYDISKQISSARTEKGMTQKDLANMLSVKQTVIQEYESGKAIPNGQLLSRIRTILGLKKSTKKSSKKK